MISCFLSEANGFLYFNNGFSGFTGLSILKVTKHISSHANLSNLHLCDFFHDSGSRNPRPLNTDRSMSTAGRSFSPQHLTLEWGTLDNSVYVFPVSTIWTLSAVFGKQSMPPPACCLSFQAARAPSPPPLQPAKGLFKGSGSQALLEKKCSPQTPSMSVSNCQLVKFSSLTANGLASDHLLKSKKQ